MNKESVDYVLMVLTMEIGHNFSRNQTRGLLDYNNNINHLLTDLGFLYCDVLGFTPYIHTLLGGYINDLKFTPSARPNLLSEESINDRFNMLHGLVGDDLKDLPYEIDIPKGNSPR